MTDLAALRSANAKRWDNAKLTRNFATVAKHLVSPDAKPRYQAVATKTGVPWAVIAVIHERESSQDWRGSLAQGDPWDRVSVHVPAARGPFKSWEEAAIDALVNCAPYAARNKDWSIGGALTRLEMYNGLGYASRGVPSPYVWSGTDQYRSGKYVGDGVYDPHVVDSQLGCAGLLMAMMALDPTITFTGSTITPSSVPAVRKSASPVASQPPSVIHPAKGSIGGHRVCTLCNPLIPQKETAMTAFLSFLAFGAGFAACWFSKDKLLIALTGATNFAKSLEAKAAAIKAAL